MNDLFAAALKLHRYLAAFHWNGSALLGPDYGVRFNWRIGRFVKSYLSKLPWKDSYYYLQAQGYWTSANWDLFRYTGELSFKDTAVRCSDHMLARQRADGAWAYPNPEWSGRIATAEGTWAALGLLDTYRNTSGKKYLGGALCWHQFLVASIGFAQIGPDLCVNYFAGEPSGGVPNNSAFVLRFLAELADVTGDKDCLAPCAGMLGYLRNAQRDCGEFPYIWRGGPTGRRRRLHFQCYQYNAFACLDLMRYHEITRDPAVPPLVRRCIEYLRRGLAEDGHAPFDCRNQRRKVTYHTAAVAAALATAARWGFCRDNEPAQRAFRYVVRLQRQDGSFPFSEGDYYVLRDERVYPRELVMMLRHLLVPLGFESAAAAGNPQTGTEV